MGKVSGFDKDRLKEEGRWLEFWNFRKKLRDSGMSAKEAQERALDEFAPVDASGADPAVVPSPAGSFNEKTGAAEQRPCKNSEKTAPPGGARSKRVVQNKPAGIELVDRAIFEGKDASVPRTDAMWAYNHFGLTDVEAKDAPSAGAWFLCTQLRTSPEFRDDYFTKIWPKLLPTANEMKRSDRMTDDGTEQIDLISEIEAARDAILSPGPEDA